MQRGGELAARLLGFRRDDLRRSLAFVLYGSSSEWRWWVCPAPASSPPDPRLIPCAAGCPTAGPSDAKGMRERGGKGMVMGSYLFLNRSGCLSWLPQPWVISAL
jgi:hypothetical protein